MTSVLDFLEPDDKGWATSCGTFAAVPFTKGQFIILYSGRQIRTCRNIDTAKRFIHQEMKKL